MEQATEILNYVWVVVIPCIVSVCSSISAIIIAINSIRKAVKDPNANIKDMRNEYKQLNKGVKALTEENAKLYEIIKEQSKQLELIQLEVENNGKEE